MKKEFMEPEMRRIELNLKERIASSTVITDHSGTYSTREDIDGCVDYYVDTWIVPSGDYAYDLAMAETGSQLYNSDCVNKPQANAILQKMA